MSFYIGNIKIENNIVLAPMAGISNPSFIEIVQNMGVGLAFTELISSEAIIRDNKKTFDMLNGIDELKIPVGIQLFGSNPDVISKAAIILTNKFKNIFIDVNMGCPVPKVALRSNSGAALLKDIDQIKNILSKLKKSVKCPITVKIRSGWDADHINAVDVAKACEECGVDAISIHPRTRTQGYSGHSDWSIIKLVKKSVKIPVIGNGDIKTIYDAEKMFNETGCDAIMIGRAALGNPWIFKQISEYINNKNIIELPSANEKIEMALNHLNNLIKYKPEKVAVLEMRNHIAWYIKGLPGSTEIKNKLYKETNVDVIISMLEDYKKYMMEVEYASKVK